MSRAVRTTPRFILGMSVRDHIGGRYAIPWIAVAVSLPINVLSTVATNLEPGADGTLIDWLLVSLSGIAAMLCVFLLAQVTVLRHRLLRPVPVWMVAIIGAVSGVVRVPVMDLVQQFLGIAAIAPAAYGSRVIAGAFLGSILLPLGAFVTSTVHQFRTQRAELLADEIALRQAQMRTEGTTAVLREALIDRVESDLSAVIDDLDGEATSVVDSLQRTGRELWAPNTVDVDVRFRWGQVFRAGVQSNPLPTALVLLIWVPTAITSFASYLPWPMTLARAAASALVIAAIFELGRRWIALHGGSNIGVLVTVLGASWFVTSPVAWWLLADRPWNVAVGTMISNAVWLTLITILGGMGVAALRSSESIVDALRNSVSETEIQALAADEELDAARREIAVLLHGPVRSRLNTSSALLSGKSEAQATDIRRELHAALRSVARVRDSKRSPTALDFEIEKVVNPWRPLLNIEASYPHVSSDLAPRAAIVLDEAIANAYRHGNARNLHVSITGEATKLEIVIDDDGAGLASGVQAGMGTQIFDRFSPDQWQREMSPLGGTRVSIVLRA